MEKIIRQTKQTMQDNLYLKLNEFTTTYDQENTGLNMRNKTIAFAEGDVLSGIECLVTAFYLENSQTGKRLSSTRKELVMLQDHVLGGRAKELKDESNPIVLIVEEETKIYANKNDIEKDNPNYEALLRLINRQQFQNHDSLVLLNKDSPLAKEYIHLASKYNLMLQQQKPVMKGLAYWIKENMIPNLEEDQQEQLAKELNEDYKDLVTSTPKALEVYKMLNKVTNEKGPLTALRSIGVMPELSNDYLEQLLGENGMGEPSFVLSDKEGNNVFCVYEEAEGKTVRLNQLYLRSLSKDEFTSNLFGGNISLNDLVLEGNVVKGDEFEKIKERYQDHSFDDNALKAMKQRSIRHVAQAQNLYEQAMRLNRKAISQRAGLMLKSLNECFDALRYKVFYDRYSAEPSERVSTTKVLEEKSNKNEEMIYSLSEAIKKLANNPMRIQLGAVMQTIYQLRNIVTEQVEEKPEEEKPEEEKPEEPQKMSMADLLGKKKK